ncbi:hypothetical protein DSO57_1002956 [Entomophthora muscae]|uniref:Uncharacterized protein n=1 Tax=Entomophthora muscae TaxID=34485 RepID=A0ACC2T8J3_9FUNG|nr:hypothetical protein DSO57_1002956 [Entomophthora muscae]
MNHLIFSAVLTACLGIGGHQYNHQHGLYNKPPDKYFYKEPVQLNSSKKYSWPTLVLPCSTQSVAIYTCVYYVLTYFAGNFGRFNVHAKVFRWMMTVCPIVTALTGFQVANLVPYLAKILPHILGLYTLELSTKVRNLPFLITTLPYYRYLSSSGKGALSRPNIELQLVQMNNQVFRVQVLGKHPAE